MKLYLHIGTEKTGTTSIQDFLVANESELFNLGFGVSKVSGKGNNRKLAAFSMRDERSDDFFEANNLSSVEARVQFKRSFQEEFESELQNMRGSVHSMIISSEHFHSRCVNKDELEKLRALLADYFDEINIVCYFRPQVELATSLYSTALRVGFTHTAVEFISNELRLDNYYYNYLNIYENWSAVFGESNINVRLYGKKNFYKGDLLEDFCHVIGLDCGSCGFIKVPSSNKSINHIGQLMLRRLNETLSRTDPTDNEIRRSFVNWLEAKYDGNGFRCPYETELMLQRQFDEVNRLVVEKASNKELGLFLVQQHQNDHADSGFEQELIDVALDLWKENNHHTERDLNIIRDPVIEFKKKNGSTAFECMKVAQKLRPHGKNMMSAEVKFDMPSTASKNSCLVDQFKNVDVIDVELDSCQVDTASYRKYHKLSVLSSHVMDVFNNEKMLLNFEASKDRLFCLKDATIFGDSFLMKGGEPMVGEGVFPEYLLDRIVNGRYRQKFEAQLKKIRTLRKVKFIYAISHPHARIYGHFLTECFPRLWVIKHFYDQGYSFPIYLGCEEPSYVSDLIRLVIPEAEIIFNPIEQGISADALLIPSYYRYYMYPHGVNVRLKRFVEAIVARNLDVKTFDKIYVSRRGLVSKTSYRQLANEEEIEKIAVDCGYHLVSPEKLDFESQITIFAKAKVIVGEYGSGLHNAIFSPVGTSVICLNWINLVQQAIGINSGHNNIFIFPDDGVPVVSPSLIAGTCKGYRVDPVLFKSIVNR